MAYNVSQEFREQCYSGESLYSCRLIIGGNTIPIEQIASITISSPIVDSNNETFYIGTFISQKLTIEFKNLDGIDTTSGTNVELYISQNVNGTDIEVPIGKYLIDESPENYYKSSKIDCLDYAIKFATNVDYSPSFVDGKTTIDNLLQWLCTYYGVILGSYPDTNGNVEIGTYDSTVSGKRWISYIAEIKGCNAKMDRLGQLTLVPIKSSPVVTIDALKSKSWELGEKFEISQVTFFDAIRNYTYGDDSENILFIRQDNPFVINEKVVENIYEKVRLNAEIVEQDKSFSIENTIEGEPIENFKFYGQTQQDSTILPSEYQQVEYIESSGTQYIDTGVERIIDKQSFEIKVKDWQYNNSYGIFGSSSWLNSFTFYGGSSNQHLRFCLSDKMFDTSVSGESISGTFKCTPTGVISDNYTFTQSTDANGGSGNIYLFAGGNGRRKSSAKVFYFKMWNETTLVRNMIPCYRKSDNVIGMYDLVNDVFYENAGTGTFTKGSNTGIPNPNYPQEIHNVSGDNLIEISGNNYNLFDGSKYDGIVQNANGTYKTTKYYNVATETIFKGLPNTSYRITLFDENGDVPSANNPSNFSMSVNGTWKNIATFSSTLFDTDNNGEATLKIGSGSYPNIGTTNRYIIITPSTETPTFNDYVPYVSQKQLISLGVENLFDKDNITKGYLDNDGTTTTGNTNDRVTPYIKVQPNTTYCLSGLSTMFSKVCTYNSSETFINVILTTAQGTPRTFTTPSNCEYIRVAVSDYNSSYEIQLEKGSKANSFSPYGTTPIELNKIGNYQDYIYKTDKWYLHKEIGKYTLNGGENETWQYNSSYTFFWTTSITNIDNQPVYTNYYLYNSSITGITGSYGCSVYQNTFRIKNTDYTQPSDLKTWLQSHNTIVYYVLATPTDTEITDTTLLAQLDNLENNSIFYDGVTNVLATYPISFKKLTDEPFICYSLTTENYGDISLDAWDTIHYTLGDEDYYTLNNNTITYAMTIMSKIETKIPTKQQEVTTNVVGGNEQQQIRRIKTEINTIDNTITLQAQEIATNTSNIATNTSNIASNTSSIGTLTTNLNGLSASFTDFYDNEYIVEVANLQDQIDGAIQFWNGPAIPTLNNYPANQWSTEADKNNHRADIYTVIEDVEGELKQGKSYRFDKVGNTWQWVELTDNELSAVQALAQQALDKSNANEQDIADLNDELSNPTNQLSGTSFDIEDALDKPLQDFKMYGDTQQDSTIGKNLLNNTYRYTDQTINGITVKNNGDGSVSMTGTATENFNISFAYSFQNAQLYGVKLPAGTYTQQCGARLSLYKTNGSWATNTYGTFTIEEDMYITSMWVEFRTGNTYDRTQWYQVEAGSQATSYEPYTNGPAPNPEFPMDIHNVSGDNTIEIVGKNLYNKDTEKDNYYYSSTGVKSFSSGNYFTTQRIKRTSDSYAVSMKAHHQGGGIVSYVRFVEFKEDGTFIQRQTTIGSATITLHNDTSYFLLNVDAGPNAYYEELQIEKGTTATEYEAYTGQSQLISLGVDMPSGYTRLDYIESSGTQYIDTGVIPTTQTGIKIQAEATTENNTDKILVGSRVGNNRFWIDFDGGSSKVVWGYGTYASTGTYSLNTKYDIDFNYNGSKKIKINGTSYNITGTYDNTGALSLYIFRANYTSAVAGNFKVYRCQIFEGTTKVRDLIPCKRDSDSAIGMLDLKHNVFYTNAGTGTFTYGNELPNGIELNKIGNYQDYFYKTDKWYLHKEYKKYYLKDFTFTPSQIASTGVYRQLSDEVAEGILKPSGNNSTIQMLCTHYEKKTANRTYSNTQGIAISQGKKIYVYDEVYNTSTGDYNTWVANNNPYFIAQLETPQEIEITDTTLLEQLNNLMTIPLIKDLTHIIITPNDLAPTLSIEYLRNTAINENFVRQPQLNNYYTRVETDAQINISSNEIQQSVIQLETLVDSNGDAISSVSNQVQNLQTSTSTQINTINQKIENGVETLVNNLVTIDINGINVSTNTSKISTIMTNSTFAIKDTSNTYLAYFGYDEVEGRSKAEMDNLTITNYLTSGAHRQEKYEDENTHEIRTGYFYIGGGN